MSEIIIDGRRIAEDAPAWVCAEIGHNHGGDVSRCKEMIRVAVECGVDAVKLQKRDNRSLFTKKIYNSHYENENSYGKTYGEHREALEFDFDQYVEIRDYCRELEVTFFATAFDFKSVDFLERLDVPCYKIASGDLLNTPLQKYIAGTGKPIILSTGGGAYDDVQRAYDAIMPINSNLVIMQCTASYPCDAEDIHLGVIGEYKKRFPGAVIGFSDHFIGKVFGPAAYILGARVFEKHFTLHKWWKGTDHKFSLEPPDLTKYIRDIRNVEKAIDCEKNILECEKSPLYKMGKKIVLSRGMVKGETLTASDIKIVSPNDGLPPYDLDMVIGRKLTHNLSEEDNIAWECLE